MEIGVDKSRVGSVRKASGKASEAVRIAFCFWESEEVEGGSLCWVLEAGGSKDFGGRLSLGAMETSVSGPSSTACPSGLVDTSAVGRVSTGKNQGQADTHGLEIGFASAP